MGRAQRLDCRAYLEQRLGLSLLRYTNAACKTDNISFSSIASAKPKETPGTAATATEESLLGNGIISVLGLKSGNTVKYGLSPREIPRAQAIFYHIS